MRKGDATRAAILDLALDTASEVGFEALTIGRLAQHAQLSKSGLFAHFRSKEQLQVETLEWARQRFVDVVVRPALAAPRGVTRLRAAYDAWHTWERTALPGGCVFVTAAAEYDDRPGPVRDALVRAQRDWLEFLSTVATTAVAEGEFREDLDPEQFAFELHGVLLAYHQASRLIHDSAADRHAHAAFEGLLRAAAR